MRAKAITIPFIREYVIERRIRRMLVLMLIVAGFTYVYFVGSSVLHIIARKDAHSQIAHIESTIANLESEYFTLSGAVSPQTAENLGLYPVSRKDFVTRTTLYARADVPPNSEL